MATKTLPDPFNAAACQAMRKYKKIHDDAVVKKGKLTKDRDAIQKDIDSCTDGEKKRKDDLKCQHYDAVHEIKRCNDIIGASLGKMMEMIDVGDQKELFESINPNPTLRTLFAEPAAADDDDDEDTKDPDERGKK